MTNPNPAEQTTRPYSKQKCPTFGTKFQQCSLLNDFALVCCSRIQTAHPRHYKIDHEGSSEEGLLVATVEDQKTCTDWNTTITVNSYNIAFKIDTGTQCNLMSSTTYMYRYVSQQPLMKSNTKLVAFGGHQFKSLGRATLLSNTSASSGPSSLK